MMLLLKKRISGLYRMPYNSKKTDETGVIYSARERIYPIKCRDLKNSNSRDRILFIY